jgi:hypothetical protein
MNVRGVAGLERPVNAALMLMVLAIASYVAMPPAAPPPAFAGVSCEPVRPNTKLTDVGFALPGTGVMVGKD